MSDIVYILRSPETNQKLVKENAELKAKYRDMMQDVASTEKMVVELDNELDEALAGNEKLLKLLKEIKQAMGTLHNTIDERDMTIQQLQAKIPKRTPKRKAAALTDSEMVQQFYKLNREIKDNTPVRGTVNSYNPHVENLREKLGFLEMKLKKRKLLTKFHTEPELDQFAGEADALDILSAMEATIA